MTGAGSSAAVLGRRLFEAFESGVPIEPLSAAGLTADRAYDVQRALVTEHLAAGRQIVARKIGLTSRAMREQLGVDEPDYGVIFDTQAFPSGATLSPAGAGMIAPRLEGELAFVLDRELSGPGADVDAVLAHTRAIVPVMEVIDSRIADWRIALADTIADNASGWGVVTGAPVPWDPAVDLTTVGMVLERDGLVLSTGAGAAVQDHPAAAVAWLANALARHGEALPAGQPILSGSLTAAVPATPGRYSARFGDGIGSVSVRVAD